MHPRVATIITVVILIVSLMGLAQTAVAQAQHFVVSECVDSVNGYTLCYEERSVVTARETPSGREVSVSVTTFSYTLSLNGEIISSDKTKSHFVQTSEGGVAQVDQYNVRRTLTYIEPATGKKETCANTFIFVYANDQIRHEDETLECPVST
jgi:hypothetical protein